MASAYASAAAYRRSSSVPLPGDFHPIALPTLPFLAARDDTYLARPSFSRASRMWYGQRRASSAGPIGAVAQRAWTMPALPTVLQRDDSPLPEADMSLFDPSFLASSSFGFSQAHEQPYHNINDFFATLPPNACPPHDPHTSISPLDNIDISKTAPITNYYPSPSTHHTDALGWLPMHHHTHSDPSSLYSGSPTPEDEAAAAASVHAPQPQHAPAFDVWKDVGHVLPGYHHPQHHHHHAMTLDLSQPSQQEYDAAAVGYFDGAEEEVQQHQQQYGVMMPAAHPHDVSVLGFTLNDMVHDTY